MEAQFVRTPKSPDQARAQVRELKAAGVDAIKAVLETGRTGMLFARMDLAMFRAVVQESGQQRLPASVHTGSARDVEDAVDAGARSIEHGSFSDAIPDAVLARMAKDGIAYDPTLSVLEGDPRSVGRPRRPAAPLAGAAGGVAEAADRHRGGDQGRQVHERGTGRRHRRRDSGRAGQPAARVEGRRAAGHRQRCRQHAGVPRPDRPPRDAAVGRGRHPAGDRAAGGDRQRGEAAARRCHASAWSPPTTTPTCSSSTAIRRATSARPSGSRLVVLKGERVRRVDLFDAAKNPAAMKPAIVDASFSSASPHGRRRSRPPSAALTEARSPSAEAESFARKTLEDAHVTGAQIAVLDRGTAGLERRRSDCAAAIRRCR